MTDIQKCTATAKIDGVDRICQVCSICYRFTATADQHQAWGAPAPDFVPEKGCKNFLQNPTGRPKNTLLR